MSRFLKIAVVSAVLVGLAVVAFAAVSFAQEPPGEPPFGPWDGLRDRMHTAMAEAVGMTVEEFDAAIAEGQTLWQIAQAQGVDLADVQASMEAARERAIDQAVADGRLTQEQADWMRSRPGGAGRGPGGMRHGFPVLGGCRWCAPAQ